MIDKKVCKDVPKEEVPKESKVITITWACNNKSNGKFRARLNAIGYKKFIESPVTSQQFLLQ